MIAHATSPRVVLAKIGLDGHDRGVKVVARGLRDAGFHVIYAGLWQPIEAVVQTALDEDADWLGISLLSGAHMTLVPPLMEQLRKTGLEHVGVLVGGIIPEKDVPKLLELGVRSVAGPGTTIAEIVERLHKSEEHESVEDLVRRFRDKDRRALARLLTIASRGQSLDALRQEVESHIGEDSGHGVHRQWRRRKEQPDWAVSRAVAVARPISGGTLLRSGKSADGRRPSRRPSANREAGRRFGRLHSQPGNARRTAGDCQES